MGYSLAGGGAAQAVFTAGKSNFAPLCWLVFQVFVNFAKQQHAEDECHAYDNRVDVADELPLRPMHLEEKV